MQLSLHDIFKARRRALGLSQAEVARRGGIQQRQVSLFERGGDVTLSTLTKLAQAIDLDLFAVPRETAASVAAVLSGTGAPSTGQTAPAPSLLERYQVKDDEGPPYG
jgi:transcriptional regulator with XRE-family HTH domain